MLGVTNLVSVNAAPGDELAFVRAGQGMVLAAGDVDDIELQERANNLRLENGGIVLASIGGNAKFGVVIKAPADNTLFMVNDEGVVCTAAESLRLGAVREKSNATRKEGRLLVTLKKTARELGLLAGAPSKNLVLVVQCKNMISTGCELRDPREFRDLDGRPLHLNVFSEPENALVALKEVSGEATREQEASLP